MHEQIDDDRTFEKPTGSRSNEVRFDRYDAIGLLFLMYGWWQLLSKSWVLAASCFAVGWLLAFAAGDKRDGFIRIMGGISKGVLNVARALVQKVSNYLAEKRKDRSGNR